MGLVPLDPKTGIALKNLNKEEKVEEPKVFDHILEEKPEEPKKRSSKKK